MWWYLLSIIVYKYLRCRRVLFFIVVINRKVTSKMLLPTWKLCVWFLWCFFCLTVGGIYCAEFEVLLRVHVLFWSLCIFRVSSLLLATEYVGYVSAFKYGKCLVIACCWLETFSAKLKNSDTTGLNAMVSKCFCFFVRRGWAGQVEDNGML